MRTIELPPGTTPQEALDLLKDASVTDEESIAVIERRHEDGEPVRLSFSSQDALDRYRAMLQKKTEETA